MRVVFRPEARTEVLEAQSWYESRSPGLGLNFIRALEAALDSAVRIPKTFALVEPSCVELFSADFPTHSSSEHNQNMSWSLRSFIIVASRVRGSVALAVDYSLNATLISIAI